ncbi:Cell wall mannoprotein CIS3 [Escovopsis weberi]|uniref:Cell wall mannoprotein CIS3 n=1 Tax=Escovopsis weberi TaxID=150374 RepID=A0A0M8N8D4_ESCWE|nr:Cell wall mannoprotein CIS3 [Escovopsis weberi]
MRSAFLCAGLVALASAAAEDCKPDFSGRFELTVVQPSAPSKRAIQAHDCSNPDALVVTLKEGVLLDRKDRIGSIVANHQFQFDAPPQGGTFATSGFSVCSDGRLALNGSNEFWQCLSGDFSNLYDTKIAPQCSAVNIIAMACDASSSSSNADGGGVDGAGDLVPVSQIGDGQIQAPTAAPPAPVVTAPPSHSTHASTGPEVSASHGSDGEPAEESSGAGPSGASTTMARVSHTTEASEAPTSSAASRATHVPVSGASMATAHAKAALAIALVGLLVL